MTDSLLKSQAFKLKGRIYTLTVLQIISTDKVAFLQQLEEMIKTAPLLFNNTPVVLDCSLITDEFDLNGLIQCMRARGLFPVAIQSNNPLLGLLAQTLSLPVLHSSSTHDKPLQSITDDNFPTDNLPTQVTQVNKMHTSPVRSGQQLVCKKGDIVVISSVSHGAELLADGNIHVYGALRGRALAGLSGDKTARIFCQSLEAELLSIAGFYRLSDAIEPYPGPCQIYLDEEERICIEPLC